MQPLTEEERKRAFAATRKPEAIRKQRLPVRYHVEDFDGADRPRRFLEAFAAILKHTNYRLALDHYMRVSAKCSRCSVKCQVFVATGDDQRHSVPPVGTAARRCIAGTSRFRACCAAGFWATRA